MRVSLDLDPANASLTGFASNATGASWPLTATNSGDGLAHRVSIKGDAATNHSAKTALLTGTDPNGVAQTETVNLPNGTATVESTKYFQTLTSVVPSATIGTDTMDIGWVDEFATWDILLNPEEDKLPVFQSVVTGTINYDIEGTLTDRADFAGQAAAPWANDSNWTGKTASVAPTALALRYRRVRVVVNSYTDTAEIQIYGAVPGM